LNSLPENEHSFNSALLVNLHYDPRWTQLLETKARSVEDLAALPFNVDLPGAGEH
jgi:hypothetical protein